MDFKWTPFAYDSKPVHLIPNYHKIETATVQRKQKDGAKLTITCPQVVIDYNQNMGVVDKHDILRQLYEIDRKSMKWRLLLPLAAYLARAGEVDL